MYLQINSEKLRELRLKKGLTCYSLAKKVGVGLKSIWRYEKNISKTTDRFRAKAIADALGCKVSDIFSEIEKE
ncbi:MAG: helix-turn-helix transcriptional regulator [Oscillospiraceae bacterium]